LAKGLPILQSHRFLTEYCFKHLLQSFLQKYTATDYSKDSFDLFILSTKKLIDLALALSMQDIMLDDTFPLALFEEAFDYIPLSHVEPLFDFLVSRRDLLLKVKLS
jgi:hypothetical protein